MATLTAHLSGLETTGLISLATTEPDLEYIFRHALIQEAAYDSLLKSERQSLHLAAGEVLEQLYGDRIEEYAPRLAEHFWEAGDELRAQLYSLMAAEKAVRSYANQEAIMHYTRALKASTQYPEVKASILQRRGELYEVMGEFELARADQETSIEVARSVHDLKAECQGLLNLGALWAARDYRKTGIYYRNALDLARQFQDPKLLAHSLNRLANYYTNVEEPAKSLSLHQEALAIFKKIGDQAGVAETMDYLGMAYALGSDTSESQRYLEQAIDRFRELGNQKGLASSLASLALATYQIESDTIVATDLSPEEGVNLANTALEISRSIGWRSGEVFSLATLNVNLISLGQYDRVIENSKRGFEILEQIQHHQWETFLRFVNGGLYLDLFAFAEARGHLERALSIAQQNYSSHWMHACSGLLGTVLVTEGQLEAAARLLDEFLPLDTPMDAPGQRLAWKARAELALAQGEPEKAIEIIQQLFKTAIQASSLKTIPYLNLLQGEALMTRAQKAISPEDRRTLLEKAEESLAPALKEAQEQKYLSKTWLLHRSLAKCYQLQGRELEAGEHQQQTRSVVTELANNISDLRLRKNFIQHAIGKTSKI